MASNKDELQKITADIVGTVEAVLATPMKDWTKEEQDEHVRKIGRTCRGPLLVDPKVEAANFKEWYVLEETGDVDGAIKMIGELHDEAKKLAAPGFKFGKPKIVVDADAPAVWDYLRRLAFPVIRLRGDKVGKPCGHDLNQEIVRHPYDGEMYEMKCPKCGTPTSWTSPVFY